METLIREDASIRLRHMLCIVAHNQLRVATMGATVDYWITHFAPIPPRDPTNEFMELRLNFGTVQRPLLGRTDAIVPLLIRADGAWTAHQPCEQLWHLGLPFWSDDEHTRQRFFLETLGRSFYPHLDKGDFVGVLTRLLTAAEGQQFSSY